MHQLWVDIGALDGKEAKELVEVGDSVTINAGFTRVLNGRAVSKAFDNRSGIFCVSEALRTLKAGPNVAVYGVSAVQEEVGLRGAKTVTYGIDPHIGVAIDVCHALDIPDANKRKAGDISIGAGPVIVRGPNMNTRLFRRLVEVAKRDQIPYQTAASGGGTGTDANAIQLTRSGVVTGLVAIPLRYMHNPCEMLALDDLDNTVRLLAALVESLSPEDDWTPGIQETSRPD